MIELEGVEFAKYFLRWENPKFLWFHGSYLESMLASSKTAQGRFPF